MAQCYRNSGSLKNGMAAQAHRTSGSFAPRLFISEKLGFDEVFYFSNVFKKQMKHSPMSYRKKCVRI